MLCSLPGKRWRARVMILSAVVTQARGISDSSVLKRSAISLPLRVKTFSIRFSSSRSPAFFLKPIPFPITTVSS
ncbi:hypothetical protein D3C87_1919510 [compost metagenome]